LPAEKAFIAIGCYGQFSEQKPQGWKAPHFTKEDAVMHLEAGCSKKNLAKMYGITRMTLYKRLTAWEMHTPRASRRQCKK